MDEPQILPFALFTALMIVFGRDFSYLHLQLGSLPLYATEIFLLLIIPSLIYSRPHQFLGLTGLSRPEAGLLLGYLGIGAARLLTSPSPFSTEALRDSALFYYAALVPVTTLVARSLRDAKQLFRIYYFASLFAALTILANFFLGQGTATSTEGIIRYGSNTQSLACATAVLCILATKVFSSSARIGLVQAGLATSMLFVVVFFVQHRSLVLVLLVGTVAIFALSGPTVRWTKPILAALGFMAIGLAFYNIESPSQQSEQVLQATVDRAMTITDPKADQNTAWRWNFWHQVAEEILERPLVGHGFGPSMDLLFHGWRSSNADPHNSYLAVAYRMGIPALALLLLLCFSIVRRGIIAIRTFSRQERVLPLVYSLLAFCSVSVYAGFNVVLEGPFMGIFFWISLGLIAAISSVASADEGTSPRTDLKSLEWQTPS